MAERNLILRAASILVAISVVLSSFTGFLIFAVGDAGQALPSNNDIDGAGDWFIGEDYKDKEKYVQGGWSLSGNLTIRSGGMVVIDGGTLEFAQEYFAPGDARNRIFSLIIEDGGKLVLKNATLTARINDIAYAFPSLGIVVRNGGVFEAYDSNIIASGHLLVDDSTFNLTRSHILGHTAVADNCDQRFFPAGEFDDSLVILFMSSRVNLFDSSIEDIYEPGNEDISERYGHEYEFARDVDAADGARLSANYLLYRMPAAIRGDTTAEEQDIESLLMNDLRSYNLGPETALWLDGIDTAGLMFSAADGVELTLNIDYAASSDFNPDDLNVFYQYRNGNPVEIAPNYYDGVLLQYSLPFMSAQDLYGLNIGVDNTGAGSISIDRLWVGVSLTLDTYRNITVAGNTDLTAVDTYLGVDMSNDQAEWNRLVMMDDSQAFFYGVYIDVSQNPSTLSDRVYPFVTIAESFEATAGSVGASDNTGEDVGAVTDNGSPSRYFEVLSNEMMSLTEFNVSEIRGTVLAVDLYVEYYVTGSGDDPQTNQIQWSDDDSGPQNTGIVPNRSPQEPPFFGYSDLYSQGLTDMASINELSIQFVNGDPVNAIQFDKIWLDITICPTIYIYRWADITVQDRDGQLVSGAEVSAKLQSTEKEAHYYTPDGIQNYPADEVLKYLGKNSENYNVTGPDGKVRIPYLSEIKNVRAENPYVNITYNATVSFKSELWGDDSKQLPIAFQTFMALTQESTSKSYTVILDGLLIQLPDLSVTDNDIGFSPEYVVFGSTVTAHVYVRNQGNIIASNVLVEAYDGTELLNSTTIDVPASGFNYATITWKIDHVGEYPINITVNPYRSIQESNYLNNEASRNITVGVEENANNYIVGGAELQNLPVYPEGLPIGKNLWIINDGVVTVDGAVLTIDQSYDRQYQIVVSGNGKLVLRNGATLQSDYAVDLILRDNAQLIVEGSAISSNVRIIAEGSSKLTFDEATVGQGINAPYGSSATIDAVNTTFDQDWTEFGGDATAHLTNVGADSLTVKDNAAIHIYRWLTVTVSDGNGHVLPGAYVAVTKSDMMPYSNGVTNLDGVALFKVEVAQLVANKPTVFLAGYFVNTTYWYDGPYEGDGPMSVNMNEIKDLNKQYGKSISLMISSAVPDVDPPIFFDDDNPARGKAVNIWTYIVNNGPVDAYGVRVLFKDNTTGTILYNQAIPVVPKGGQANAVNVSFSWTAIKPLGEHEIFLSVDPYDEIKEVDETNNNNTRLITVRGIADLVVGVGDITLDPVTPVRERSTTISVKVTNTGDVEANAINVSVYAVDPLGERKLVGTQLINVLPNGTSASVSVSWTPIMAGSHTIQVVVDGEENIEDINRGNNEAQIVRSVLNFPDLRVTTVNFSPPSPVAVNDEIVVTANILNIGGVGVSNVVVNFYLNEVSEGTLFYQATIPSIPAQSTGQALGYLVASLAGGVLEDEQTVIVVVNPDGSIPETDYENNEGEQRLIVKENRADIIFTGELNVGNDLGPVDSAAIGENVYLSIYAKNNGTVTAYDVLFVFYAVDDMGLGTEIGRVYKYMAIGQDVELNITWTVNMTMGDYTLAVISNPDGAVEEIDDADNIASIGITVEAPNTKITFDRLPEPSYEPGKAVLVSGKVSNSNTNAGVSGASLEIWLEKDGQKVGESVNGTTRADGTFGVTLHLRQGLDGQYRIVVSATIGGETETTSQLVQVKAAPEGGIPWYVYLLIFALVSAVIIAFSAYLYKYGLGRMVECGECAALIPEASKRCPKCGVQFEPGTAKCSECSAWIPSNSTQCPECGTKFITEAIKEEEDAYIKRMREQYEAYVETYREEAKLEMGRKYTDARFPNWWKKHSAFISFEQWLSQEEAKLKSGGTLCPVCGIHNPRGSPICQKCGSTLEVPKAVGKMPDEPAKDAPPRKPLRRMIVRRPVPGTGKDKPASPEAKAEGEAPKADPKAAEEGADKSASGPAGEPSDEAPKP